MLSTGVIGQRLPLHRLLPGLEPAVAALSDDGGPDAAEAIMTTDTRSKEAAVSRDGFTVGGMTKGSGMIHPDLATMLAVVTTDYPLEPGEAIDFLRPAVEASFNAISVDGEPSTNDCVILLANGASGAAAQRRGVRGSARPRSAPTWRARWSPTARASPCSPRSTSPAPSTTTRRGRSRAGSRPRRS